MRAGCHLFVTAAAASAAALASACTSEDGVDYYIPSQGPAGNADSARDCCVLCQVTTPTHAQTPYYTWQHTGPCYCKCELS